MAIRIEPRDPLTQAQGVEAGYAQTARRWPSQPLVRRPLGAAELSGPQQLARRLPPAGEEGGDLAGYGDKRAIGQLVRLRIRVLDEDGAPLPGTVVEVWHCNAAGKYIHPNDTHDAPVDPNFYGAARARRRRHRPDRAAHHQARRLPGPRHRRLVAPAARAPLGVGTGVALAPGDADVLPRRAAQRSRRHPQRHPRPRRARALRRAPGAFARRSEMIFEHQLVVRGRKASAGMP